MARYRSKGGYRPGTASYARERAAWLKQQANLTAANAARAKRPEARKRALTKASKAKAEVRAIEAREEFRQSLSELARKSFDRQTLKDQRESALRVREMERQYPNGVPQGIPDPAEGPQRNPIWNFYYSRQGVRRSVPRREAAD